MSDNKQICAALVKAQTAFGKALKTNTNPAFRSKYADLGACIEAVIDALHANGIALIQKQHPNEGGVAVETVFVHESGEMFSAGMLTVPASKQDPQGYGSALTYARRYSLMAACAIAPEDDDGNAGSKPRAVPKIRGTDGAAEVLSDDEKRWLGEFADSIHTIYAMDGPMKTFDHIKRQNLEEHQTVYLWSLLPSDMRSALKAEGDGRRAANVALSAKANSPHTKAAA